MSYGQVLSLCFPSGPCDEGSLFRPGEWAILQATSTRGLAFPRRSFTCPSKSMPAYPVSQVCFPLMQSGDFEF